MVTASYRQITVHRDGKAAITLLDTSSLLYGWMCGVGGRLVAVEELWWLLGLWRLALVHGDCIDWVGWVAAVELWWLLGLWRWDVVHSVDGMAHTYTGMQVA